MILGIITLCLRINKNNRGKNLAGLITIRTSRVNITSVWRIEESVNQDFHKTEDALYGEMMGCM